MNRKRIIRMLFLNAGLAFVNTVAFSEGLIGLRLNGKSPLETAVGFTLLLMSVLVFGYGNYRILTDRDKVTDYTMSELDEPQEFIDAFNRCQAQYAFANEINTAIGQVQRLDRKMTALKTVLLHNYQDELSEFGSLQSIAAETRDLLYENLKKMLNRIMIFDQDEYERLRRLQINTEALKDKWNLLLEHLAYVKMLVDRNEKILLEFDNLLVEVTRLNESNEEEKDLKRLQSTITAMKDLRTGNDSEMDELARKYEQASR